MTSPTGTPSAESIGLETVNPTVISDEIKAKFAKHSVFIGKLIRKGLYGAVYDGQFGPKFSAKEFKNQFKCDSCHVKTEPEQNRKFALKFIDIPVRTKLEIANVRQAVRKELTALMAIQFVGIVEFYFAVSLNDKNLWFLFLELSDGNLQTLSRHKRRANQKISYKLAKKWLKSLCQSLKYLHEKNIIHGQIKASNILYFTANSSDETIDVKFADFCNSHKLEDKQSVEEKRLMEDMMDEDMIDLYFVFTYIFSFTAFSSESEQHLAEDLVYQLIGSEGNSIQLLNTLLMSDQLSQ